MDRGFTLNHLIKMNSQDRFVMRMGYLFFMAYAKPKNFSKQDDQPWIEAQDLLPESLDDITSDHLDWLLKLSNQYRENPRTIEEVIKHLENGGHRVSIGSDECTEELIDSLIVYLTHLKNGTW
jgi:hypothetical protein